MSIEQYLDLSTAHLTQYEMTEITACSQQSWSITAMFCGSRVVRHSYGAFVHVPPFDYKDESARGAEVERAIKYPNLHQIIVFARKEDVMWINFDRDGDTDTRFPIFEW